MLVSIAQIDLEHLAKSGRILGGLVEDMPKGYPKWHFDLLAETIDNLNAIVAIENARITFPMVTR